MSSPASAYPVPVPLTGADVVGIKQAARLANTSGDTIRRWCVRYGIGRQVDRGSAWRISAPALRMVINADFVALDALRMQGIDSPLVKPYLSVIAA